MLRHRFFCAHNPPSTPKAQPKQRKTGRSEASAPSTRGGDDDQRRAFPPPREGLPLCVAPYFADRGVGDMRGPPTPPTMMPPRRWWQAVIVPRYTTETQQYTSHHDGSNSPAPPPGCDLGGTPPRPPRMSPRPRVAKYGATHGCHHLPGWLKCPPLVIVSAVGGEADSALRPTTALRGCTFGTHIISSADPGTTA